MWNIKLNLYICTSWIIKKISMEKEQKEVFKVLYFDLLIID